MSSAPSSPSNKRRKVSEDPVEHAVRERWRPAYDAAVALRFKDEVLRISIVFQDSPYFARVVSEATIDLREFNSRDAKDIVKRTLVEVCPPSQGCVFGTILGVLSDVVYLEQDLGEIRIP
jgi:hypothetical protein